MLPLSDFYKHPQMGDGHVNKCKECNKKDVQANYRANRDYYRKYEAKRQQRAERRVANQRYQKTRRERFPKKYKARMALGNAVRDGRVQRHPCERCGSLRVHGHHEDYSKPLDVVWLCVEHHHERHAELRAQGIEL